MLSSRTFKLLPSAFNCCLVLLLLSACQTSAQDLDDPHYITPDINQVKANKLRGEVSRMKVQYFLRYDGEVDYGYELGLEEEWEFNKAGQASFYSKSLSLYEDEPVKYYLSEYDAHGRLVERKHFEDEDQLARSIQRVYYGHGRLREEQEFRGDGHLLSRKLCTYDDSLNLVESRTILYSEEGEEPKEIRMVYEYEKGKRKKELRYDGDRVAEVKQFRDGRMVRSQRFSKNEINAPTRFFGDYSDPHVTRIKKVTMEEKGREEERKEIYYDDLGRISRIRKAIFRKDDRWCNGDAIGFTYDSLGNQISAADTSVFMVLDQNGHLALDTNKVGKEDWKYSPSSRACVYTYDDQRNWIKKEEFINEFLVRWTTREIEYYPSSSTQEK